MCEICFRGKGPPSSILKGEDGSIIKRWSSTHHINLTFHRPHNLRNNGTVRVIIKEIIWQNRIIIGSVAHLYSLQHPEAESHQTSGLNMRHFLKDMLTLASLRLPAASWRGDRKMIFGHVGYWLLWGTLDRVLSKRHHPHCGSGQTFVKTSLYPQQPFCSLSEFSPQLMSVLLPRGTKGHLERQQGTKFNMNTSDRGECLHWPGQLELISVTPCFIVSLHLVITQASVQGSQG